MSGKLSALRGGEPGYARLVDTMWDVYGVLAKRAQQGRAKFSQDALNVAATEFFTCTLRRDWERHLAVKRLTDSERAELPADKRPVLVDASGEPRRLVIQGTLAKRAWERTKDEWRKAGRMVLLSEQDWAAIESDADPFEERIVEKEQAAELLTRLSECVADRPALKMGLEGLRLVYAHDMTRKEAAKAQGVPDVRLGVYMTRCAKSMRAHAKSIGAA